MISTLQEGEQVLAYNEAQQANGDYPITQVIHHQDHKEIKLSLRGPNGQTEVLETTAEHPFYVTTPATQDQRPAPVGHEELNTHWVGAGHLQTGDKLKLADGRVGEVLNVSTVQKTQEMFNLSVQTAHTFYVGTQGWLVHNCDPISRSAGNLVAQQIRTTLNLGTNKRTIAYADIYIKGLEGRIIGVSGSADYGETLAKRLGARFAGPTNLTGPSALDGERKILEDLRRQLSLTSTGTINLFIDPARTAGKGFDGKPVGGAC